jgi:phosphate transport system substrate-binding protein
MSAAVASRQVPRSRLRGRRHPAAAALATACCSIGLACGAVPTSLLRTLPPYQPEQHVTGVIRVWGSPEDAAFIEGLEAGFRKYQPHVRFQETLHGPESTFAAVYMDVADLGFMAREIRVPLETMAFEWVHHYRPVEIEIANAGLGLRHGGDRPGVSLAFLVNTSNPLSCLTLKQFDDIFGADPRRGGREVRSWGGLGLGDGWTDQPIHVYGPPLDDVSTLFVRRSVLEGSRKWNAGYRIVPGGWSAVPKSVARDRNGITFAPPFPPSAGTKALRVARSSHSPCYPATAQTIESRQYPLARIIGVALDRRPGRPIPARIQEFLRFILSRQGQAVVARSGAYLPLDAATVRSQRRRIE